MTDLFPPFSRPWRARLPAARRALPRTDPPQPLLHQLEALFTALLPRHWLCPEEQGDCSRQRDWPLRRTFWTFLAQVLSAGSACRAAVRQAQAAARLGRTPVLIAGPVCVCRGRASRNSSCGWLAPWSSACPPTPAGAGGWSRVADGSTV